MNLNNSDSPPKAWSELSNSFSVSQSLFFDDFNHFFQTQTTHSFAGAVDFLFLNFLIDHKDSLKFTAATKT